MYYYHVLYYYKCLKFCLQVSFKNNYLGRSQNWKVPRSNPSQLNNFFELFHICFSMPVLCKHFIIYFQKKNVITVKFNKLTTTHIMYLILYCWQVGNERDIIIKETQHLILHNKRLEKWKYCNWTQTKFTWGQVKTFN